MFLVPLEVYWKDNWEQQFKVLMISTQFFLLRNTFYTDTNIHQCRCLRTGIQYYLGCFTYRRATTTKWWHSPGTTVIPSSDHQLCTFSIKPSQTWPSPRHKKQMLQQMICSVLHANLQFFAAAPKQRADLHLKGQLSYYLKGALWHSCGDRMMKTFSSRGITKRYRCNQ